MTKYVYSTGGDYSIMLDGKQSDICKRGPTCATVIESYAGDEDGLSIAIYRACYLAKKNMSAQQAVDIALAIHAAGPRAAHEAWIMEGIQA